MQKPIPLLELEARFVRIVNNDAGHWSIVDDIKEAQGLWFLCPLCFARAGDNEGVHGVLCWFQGRQVPVAASPGPGRWGFVGSAIDDLSLTPSVMLNGGCNWHGFVRHGQAEFV